MTLYEALKYSTFDEVVEIIQMFRCSECDLAHDCTRNCKKDVIEWLNGEYREYEVWQNPESLNVPKSPIELDEDCGVVAYKCPRCGGIAGFKSKINSRMPDKCDNCGQHLNWIRC